MFSENRFFAICLLTIEWKKGDGIFASLTEKYNIVNAGWDLHVIFSKELHTWTNLV